MALFLECDGVRVPGQVLDLSIHGCGATFESRQLPALRRGDGVCLEFRALLLLEPLRIEACVRRRVERGSRVRIGFEFSSPEAVRSEVPYVLLSEFNCRAHPRATIDDVVNVRVQVPGLEDVALLVDVSAGGVQLRVSPRLASRIHEGDPLELRFTLPERPQGFWLAGTVRGLRVAGDYVGCSVSFDARTTVDFEEQRSALEDTVAQRRRVARSRRERGRTA